MKRRKLLQHLNAHDCYLVREGKKHSVFSNSENGKISTIPRHEEIPNPLVRKICFDLDIPYL